MYLCYSRPQKTPNEEFHPFKFGLQNDEGKVLRWVHGACHVFDDLYLSFDPFVGASDEVGGVGEEIGSSALVDPCSGEALEVDGARIQGRSGDGGENVGNVDLVHGGVVGIHQISTQRRVGSSLSVRWKS